MKRFLLFTFDTLYPSGGWDDFVNSFDTPEEALKHYNECRTTDYQIVDSKTGSIVLVGFGTDED